MSKPKKVTYSKNLVRNTKSAPLKVTITKNSSAVPAIKTSYSNEENLHITSRKPQKPANTLKLNEPDLNSSLNIEKQIDAVVKTKVKPKVSVDNKTVDDKITRFVNFPSEKPIFRDLIPLGCQSKLTQVSSTREPLPPKDKEPVLSDFIEPRKVEEFSYVPNIKFETEKLHYKPDYLKLYKILQMEKENSFLS